MECEGIWIKVKLTDTEKSVYCFLFTSKLKNF